MHLPCSLLWHLGWSWTRGEERALHQGCRRSLLFAGNGRSCCSTVGSLSRPTIFVKNPSFVRSSVHPSVYTKIARFCNLPRSCSIYKPCFSTTHCQCVLLSFAKRCLLLSLAGPLSQVVHAWPAAHRPTRPTARHRPRPPAPPPPRMSVVRRSQVIGAWWWLFGRLAIAKRG